MWRSVLVVLGACGVTNVDATATLRVEPDAVDLDVDLAQPAPTAVVHVYVGDRDVTADAKLVLAGARLGTLFGGVIASDGTTGGEATLEIAYAGAHASVPVTAHVHGARFAGVAATAADAFAGGPRIAVAAELEPGDGAMIPPNLGRMDVDFTADDADTLHEIAVHSPWLDVRVYAPGAPGPRHVELAEREWRAIAATSRGGEVELDVASTSGAPGAPIHQATAHVAIGELDARALAFTASFDGTPRLWRYDVARAAQAPLASLDACVGCHVAVSPDGTRLATASNGAGVSGYLFDLARGTLVARTDDVGDWTAATFTADGHMVTSLFGALTLRDATTGRAIAPIPTRTSASEPTASPDGSALAYVSLETVGDALLGGDAIDVMTRDPQTGAYGAPLELARGAAMLEPEMSSDGQWVAYTRNESQDRFIYSDTDVVSLDGATTVRVTTGPFDGLARWASPVVNGRAWIALVSTRALGGIRQPPQLWLAAIDLATATVSRPIHLPAQTHAWGVMHAPMSLP